MNNGRWEYIRRKASEPDGLTTDDLVMDFGLAPNSAWVCIHRYLKTNTLYRAKWPGEPYQHYFLTEEGAAQYLLRSPTFSSSGDVIRIFNGQGHLDIPKRLVPAVIQQLQEAMQCAA